MTTFGPLAKRVSAWTSRAIVTAAILVAALAFGRQVLQWWGVDRTEPGSVASPSLAVGALGDPSQEHCLEFGDSRWQLTRSEVRGNAAAALGEIVARSAAVVGSSAVPEGEPGPAERSLFDQLARMTPVREVAGQWQLFAVDSAFPMAVGTRWIGDPHAFPADRIAKTQRRVVTWGLAVPAGGDAWTVYTFHTASLRGDNPAIASDLPIPPGGRKTLAIRAADGGAVVAFKGPRRPGQWEEFFDGWLAAHTWKATTPWQHGPSSLSVRAVRESGESLDVLLRPEGTDEMTGVVLLTPANIR